MIELPDASRRRLIAGLSGVVLAAGSAGAALAAKKEAKPPAPPPEKKIGAVENLMRQHGVLSRVLLVYRHAAAQLRGGTKIDPKLLRQTAQLFRDFGENFHERMLEQTYVSATRPQKLAQRSLVSMCSDVRQPRRNDGACLSGDRTKAMIGRT